jgi:hypothetical protein
VVYRYWCNYSCFVVEISYDAVHVEMKCLLFYRFVVQIPLEGRGGGELEGGSCKVS